MAVPDLDALWAMIKRKAPSLAKYRNPDQNEMIHKEFFKRGLDQSYTYKQRRRYRRALIKRSPSGFHPFFEADWYRAVERNPELERNQEAREVLWKYRYARRTEVSREERQQHKEEWLRLVGDDDDDPFYDSY